MFRFYTPANYDTKKEFQVENKKRETNDKNAEFADLLKVIQSIPVEQKTLRGNSGIPESDSARVLFKTLNDDPWNLDSFDPNESKHHFSNKR